MGHRIAIGLIVLGVTAGSALGDFPTIHVTWEAGQTPVEGVDYVIITCAPGFAQDCERDDFPDVELRTPNDSWQISSTDPDNPGEIGDIGVISTPNPGFFHLQIGGAQVAGARDVKGISLKPPGGTSFSKLSGSRISGNLLGELTVTQSMSGVGGQVSNFIIDGDALEAMTIPVILFFLSIGGDLSGDVEIGTSLTPDLTGDLSVGGDCDSDIHVAGNVTSDASIVITGGLDERARILVDGRCNGSISIGEETGVLTLIHLMDGLGSDATLEVNTTEGVFDANGVIHVGLGTIPDPPNDITFDGSIQIHDDGAGGGGDLLGGIAVVGCHATADDLQICLDGGNGGNNIIFRQVGCTNQVDWSCTAIGL